MSLPRDWSVGIVIPARDEEATIERCIECIIAAGRGCGSRTRTWIVVVADCCADETALRARRALGEHGEVIECALRSPGAARRMGTGAALAHFETCPLTRLWLANTDADTFVPLDWLRLHLELAEAGANAVAGVVQLDARRGDDPAVARFFEESYFAAGDGSHSHVHGANFGVRADAYLDVGGWSLLALAEDHCLWHRLKAAGWKLCSSVRSVVATSARLHGRAAGGFADTLRAGFEAREVGLEASNG